jgi:RNA polymerase sigma-70 factor (ECF subfamily)
MSGLGEEWDRAGPRVFATTHWSVVLAAGAGESEPSRRALEMLCRAYWYPIYVYVRRKGHGPDEAQELTQEFFAQLIARDKLRLADREKGRFRTFLLSVLDYFLAREWSRAHRQKRGGQFQLLSLDQSDAENRYRLELADHETPRHHFERQWAFTVLKQAITALEAECQADGSIALFGEVRHLLSGERPDAAYGGIANRLKMTEGALRVAVHRLRRRYGELLRAEIAQTVETPAEAEEELRYLLQILSD